MMPLDVTGHLKRSCAEGSKLLRVANRRSSTVLPMCKFKAQHITIDTKVLFYLCQNAKLKPGKLRDFRLFKLDSWRDYFRDAGQVVRP